MSVFPATLLRLISLCQIICSEAGRVVHYPARLTALLCHDFAVRYESSGCDKHSFPTPSSGAPSVSCRSTKKNFGGLFWSAVTCHRFQRQRLVAARRLRSHSKIMAQESRKACGVVYYTPRLRADDLAKRDEAQGGSGAVGRATRSAPLNPRMSIHSSRI